MTNPNQQFVLVHNASTPHVANMLVTWADLGLDSDNLKPGAAFFSTEEEARAVRVENVTKSEGSLSVYPRVMTLAAYLVMVADMVTDLKSNRKRTEFLESTIETFLEEGVEGALDPDDFIHDHKALAEAIGFEYEEEKTYTIAVTVTAKHRRGYFINTYDFSVGVESDTSEVEVIDFDIDSVDEQ